MLYYQVVYNVSTTCFGLHLGIIRLNVAYRITAYINSEFNGHEILFTGCKNYIIDSSVYSNNTRILDSKYWYHHFNGVNVSDNCNGREIDTLYTTC